MHNFTFGLVEKLFKWTYRRYGSQGCRVLGFSSVALSVALFFIADLIASDPLAIVMRFVSACVVLIFLIEWHAISVKPLRD